MLVIEPTGGHSVGARSERFAHDSSLERAGVIELVPQPCPGQRTVAGVFQIPPPAVFEGPDDVVVGEINVDAEGIKHKPADVSAPTVACVGGGGSDIGIPLLRNLSISTGVKIPGILVIITINVTRPYGPTDVQFSLFGFHRFNFWGLRLNPRLCLCLGKFFSSLLQFFFQRLNALLNLRCRSGQSRWSTKHDRHTRRQNSQC